METGESLKHILFLPEWYPNPEDIQIAIFVEKFARAAAKNHRVSLIFCAPFSTSGKIELLLKKEENFTSYFCYYPKQRNRFKAYKYFINAHRLCFDKLKKDEGVPDLVHLHMLFRNYVAYRKVYRKEIPSYLITEQWSGYLNGTYEKMSFIKKSFYKKAFSKAYFVTAVSQKLAKALNQHFEIQNPVLILPNVVETIPRQKEKNNNQFSILVVADLVDAIKNVSGTLKAFENAQFESKASLTIIGEGSDREMLEKMTRQLTLKNKQVEFKGRKANPEVLEAMTQHDILVTNSRHETFSMVTAEALLAGMPVICTKCGGPQEFVNESNGILIEVDDTLGLTNALETMSRNHKQYDNKTLSQPVLEKFGLEAVSERLKNIYDRILSR